MSRDVLFYTKAGMVLGVPLWDISFKERFEEVLNEESGSTNAFLCLDGMTSEG